jgi:chromate transporter
MKLLDLAALIFVFNVMTFGNGPVMVPLLHDHLVIQRGVLTEDQLLYAFTIARVTPGQANLYVAAIGYMLFGLPGAILTTLAVMLPGYLMIPLMGGFERLRASPMVTGFTKGLMTASVGLIFAAAVQIGRGTLNAPVAWAVFCLMLVLTQVLKLNTILSLLIASGVGLLLKVVF